MDKQKEIEKMELLIVSDILLEHNAKDTAKHLAEAGYGNINEAEAEIERLRTELEHREEDLVHADENVFYRECEVALNEKNIKKQAVSEYIDKLKELFKEKHQAVITSIVCCRADEIFKELYGEEESK